MSAPPLLFLMMRLLVAVQLAIVLPAVARAGDVTVTVKSGALVVKGDDDLNGLTIDSVGLGTDAVRVTPGGPTTINGTPGSKVFTGLTGAGAKITLGDSPDLLSFQSLTLLGKISIKTGTGSDRLRILDTTLGGPTKIDLGAGDNSMSICGAVLESDVAIKFGKGTGGGSAIQCDVTGGLASVDATVMIAEEVAFGGTVSVKAPAGLHIAAIADSTVAGALTTKNMALATLCYSGVGGPVTVAMANILGAAATAECTGGMIEASASGNTAFAMAGATLGAGLTVKTAAGNDSVGIAGTPIAGATTVSLGGGENFLALGLVQTASLVAKAGKGQDDFFADQLTVHGNATFKYGDGANVLDFGVSTIDGDLTVKTGSGDDHITISTLIVNGDATVDDGKGNDTINN